MSVAPRVGVRFVPVHACNQKNPLQEQHFLLLFHCHHCLLCRSSSLTDKTERGYSILAMNPAICKLLPVPLVICGPSGFSGVGTLNGICRERSAHKVLSSNRIGFDSSEICHLHPGSHKTLPFLTAYSAISSYNIQRFF